MPFVSGSYQRFYGSTGWTDDKNAAVFILASRHDTHDQDIADGINTAVGKIRLGDTMILSSVSGTNTILGSLTPSLTVYAYGLRVILTPSNTNTGATTLNVNSLGALAVQNIDGSACLGGELVATFPAELMLNSGATAWIIVNPNVGKSRGIEVGYRGQPFSVQSGNYTFVQADNGTVVYYTGTGGHTFTLPTLTGNPVIGIRNGGSAALTIAQTGTALSWYNGSGTIPSGSRTLAVSGACVADFNTSWNAIGTGLS